MSVRRVDQQSYFISTTVVVERGLGGGDLWEGGLMVGYECEK